MRMNVDNYRCILSKSGLNDAEVCKRTGLTEKSLIYILNNGFLEISTLERIADALHVPVKVISKPDSTGCNENVIEFVKDSNWATVTVTQGRYKSRIEKLAAERPEECEIVVKNRDGSMTAHIPVSWIRINPSMNLTEEQRKRIAERMRQNRKKHNASQDEKQKKPF